MTKFPKLWRELRADRHGATALEYAIIAGIIVATVLLGFDVLANAVSARFTNIGGSL